MYDKDRDYRRLMEEAAARGDFRAAAAYEQQRNEKILAEGLDYDTTAVYQPYAEAAQRMDALGKELAQRGEFSYEVGRDPLYAQAREQAQREGRRAMDDAVGRAAALTGGYGNSYAQSAGQQGYDRSMQALEDRIPELYRAAYDRWRDEETRLREGLTQAMKQENTEYGRLLEELERQTAAQRYEYSRADAAQKAAQTGAATAENRAYQLALTMLKGGELPGESTLQAAGLSREDALKLLRAFARSGG